MMISHYEDVTIKIIDSCESCDIIPTSITGYQNYDLTLGSKTLGNTLWVKTDVNC